MSAFADYGVVFDDGSRIDDRPQPDARAVVENGTGEHHAPRAAEHAGSQRRGLVDKKR